jgi:hypothetical protein
MKTFVIYLGHRFDLRYFLALARQSRHLQDEGAIELLVDPSESLKLTDAERETLRSEFQARSMVVLPKHEFSGPWRRRLKQNYLRVVAANRAIENWNDEGATFILNNKASFVGHLICSKAARAILIQQEGDVRVPNVYRFSWVRTLRANVWYPRVGGRVKRVFVSKGASDLQHHEVSYPNVRICYDTVNPHLENRVYVGSPHGLFDIDGSILWFGSRCMDWTFFGVQSVRALELAIMGLAERHRGVPLQYKPRKQDETGELELLCRHWKAPVSVLDWRPEAESLVDAGCWSGSYSIGSTASIYTRSAGIPTQVMYRSIGLPSPVERHMDTIFKSVPSSFFYGQGEQHWPPTDQSHLPSHISWLESTLEELGRPET